MKTEKELREMLKRGEEAEKYNEEVTKSERYIMFWSGWNTAIRRILGEIENE